MASKNYGTLLQKGGVTVGEIVSVSIPEVIANKAETTNHSSGGWRSFIPVGLKELGEFGLTLNATGSLVSSIFADISAETVSTYSVVYPTVTSGSLTNWTFSGFPTSLKIQDASADSPDVMQIEVKYQASGSLTIA